MISGNMASIPTYSWVGRGNQVMRIRQNANTKVKIAWLNKNLVCTVG
jgi:hypothetical protein